MLECEIFTGETTDYLDGLDYESSYLHRNVPMAFYQNKPTVVGSDITGESEGDKGNAVEAWNNGWSESLPDLPV